MTTGEARGLRGLTAALSPEARRVLELTGANGVIRLSVVLSVLRELSSKRTARVVLAELELAGIVHTGWGMGAGLTERGFAIAQIVQDEHMDRLGL